MGILADSPSEYGNNNSSAVVATAALLSSKSTVHMMPVDPDPDYASVEHILLHFRILLEFFFHHRGGTEDRYVFADDFIDRKFAEVRPQWANVNEGRCNDLIAHLSHKRFGYRQKNEHHWRDILEDCKAMDEEITRFLTVLESSSPSRRAWFKSVVD